MKTAAAVPAAALGAPAAAGTKVTAKIVRLNLRHTWTTTMSSSDYRDTLHTTYERDGLAGHGEGAPIVRYHEDAESARKAVESVRDLLLAANPMQFDKIMAEVFQRVQGEWAGKAAIDIALMDWVGQKLGIPLYTLFRTRSQGRAADHVLDRDRHTRDHQTEDAGGGRLSGSEGESGTRHGRADHRSRAQRDEEAAAGGRQRGVEG